MRRVLLAALFLLAAGCTATPRPVPAYTAQDLGALRYKAVLVAGDASADVFDNAVRAMDSALVARGAAPSDIAHLSASPGPNDRGATLAAVLGAVAAMKPGPGQACLVFATSHGTQGTGLVLSRSREFLTPSGLDAALAEGCGAAPTVVVVSGCYTGPFATPPMAAPNRIVLTAARADRPSFGCRPGREFTFYDRCLLTSLDTAPDWASLQAETRGCVTRAERAGRLTPSEPQLYVGQAVATLPIPRRTP